MRVGWIGAGAMGRPMAQRLIGDGHTVFVHTRTAARAEELVEAGAQWAETPAACAADADAVFTMLSMPDDVESVYLGRGGLIAASAPGTLLVDMTTSSPALARTISTAASGREVLDAPVSGGPPGAQSGALSIMVGGSDTAFARARPLLEVLGSTVVHHGGPGAGQTAKLINQVLIAGVMGGIAEAFTLVRRAEIDPELIADSVGQGAAGSWLLNYAWPRLIAGDEQPGFRIEHFLKDLGLAIEFAAGLDTELAATETVRELYQAVADAGGGGLGTQALGTRLVDRAPSTCPLPHVD